MRPRRGRVVVPSVLAGLLISASLPPWGWWPLAFAGAALLSWRLRGLAPRARALAGWTAGVGWLLPGLWWAFAFNVYGGAALVVAEAAFPALAALLVPARRGHGPAFAGAFTLLEAARMHWPFGGLPIAGVFLGQAGGPLLAAARLGGALLMTGLVFVGGAGIDALLGGIVATVRTARARRAAAAGSGAAGSGAAGSGAAGAPSAPAIAAAGGAVWVLAVVAVVLAGLLAPSGGAPVRRLTVALVQGGGRRGTSATEVPASAVMAAQVAATAPITARTDPPALVVWPEDVVGVGRHLAGSAKEATVASLARRLHATVLAGVTVLVSSTHFRNEAVAWGPRGRIVGSYEKVHRVPFGEYVPYRSFFSHLASLAAVPRDAIAGHGTGKLTTPAATLGIMLSYEVFFATRGRDATRAGATVLVVPTNTSSYATSQIPTMEVAADRVQAVAEGRTLVQAAPTGYSTVVTADGTVRQRSVLGRRQVLVATVALRRGSTVFERFGSLPVIALAALALTLGLAAALAARRRRGRRPGAGAPA